jgi:hypothetical protein
MLRFMAAIHSWAINVEAAQGLRSYSSLRPVRSAGRSLLGFGRCDEHNLEAIQRAMSTEPSYSFGPNGPGVRCNVRESTRCSECTYLTSPPETLKGSCHGSSIKQCRPKSIHARAYAHLTSASCLFQCFYRRQHRALFGGLLLRCHGRRLELNRPKSSMVASSLQEWKG